MVSRTNKFIVIYILFFSFIISAQNITLPLWKDNIPNSTNVEVEESNTGSHKYVIPKPEMAVYLPSERNTSGQAVLVIPGGGYHAIAYTWEGTDVAKWLNANGIVAAVLKYRLPNDTTSNIVRYKSPLLDASRAIRIIKANAEKWNIDKNNIGVMGFSAGGHIASTLGTHFNQEKNRNDKIDSLSSRPDFMVLMYPVITMSGKSKHKGSTKNLLGENPSEELLDYYSNEKHVASDTPPTFLVHSSDDRSVPVKNSLLFYEALIKNNVSAEMHIYKKGGHGFSLANKKGYLSSWKNRCLDWLNNLNEK
jgi:acetyl esterase/lipase